MDGLTNIPKHLAIIMDGNGRWAEAQGLPRVAGYSAGLRNIHRLAKDCLECKIEILTLYAPPTEEWWHPELEQALDEELQELHRMDAKLSFLGRLETLPGTWRRKIRKAMELTAGNGGIRLNLAFNYSGRAEIVDAVRRMAEEGIDPSQLDEDLFGQYLYMPDLPEPDLIIHTGGEIRLFDIFIWQGAYAEHYATSVCWPDFDSEELHKALLDYSKRERRFGLLKT